MPQSPLTINPTTTASARSPGFRGQFGSETYKSQDLAVTTSAAITLAPVIESYPATFLCTTGTERTTKAAGFITAVSASVVVIHGASAAFLALASVGTTADNLGVSITGGQLVFTNAGTNPATAVTNIYVTRIA